MRVEALNNNIPISNRHTVVLKEQFSQLVRDKQEECCARTQSGSFEQSFQIGSGSYTENEWEKLLKRFDAAEARLQESAERERLKTSEMEHSDEENEIKEKSIDMLFAEFTTAVYPSDEEDISDDIYFTFYTSDGIFCRKQGESELEWQIPFETPSQFDKVMSYLQSLDSQHNLRFACHENFWQDFLNDRIDMDEFNGFMENRVADGVPNYLNIYETGVNIDTEAAQYSKYMNLPDFVKNMCYTTEEAFDTFFRNGPAAANKSSDHRVINTKLLDQYYIQHPDEAGKRNHYYNGKWYSMAELIEIWNRELAELFDTDS